MTRDEEIKEKKLSQKELAKKMRREAYLRAKERRKNDPQEIARKAEAKELRRAQYQKAKERVKAEKTRRKAEEALKTDSERGSEQELLLRSKLKRASELGKDQTAEDEEEATPEPTSVMGEVIAVDFRRRNGYGRPKNPPR